MLADAYIVSSDFMGTIPNTRNLNIRADATLKEESDTLFKNLGLNVSTAINMFLRKCVKTSSIPFKIEDYSSIKQLEKTLKEIKYMKKHSKKYETYNSAEDLFMDLDD